MQNQILEVNLHSNPKNSEGLAIQFPYSEWAVDRIHLVLGAEWDKANKLWISQGPEILLDMERFGVKPVWLSGEARQIAEDFREQLWKSLEARAEPIDDEEYGYQRQGSKFLALQKAAILGDDPGLGKSKQALDAAAEVGAKKILILAPKTITYNWPEEIEKWHPEYTYKILPDHKSAKRIHRSKEVLPGRQEIWENQPNIVIANYEKLRLDDWPFKIEWDVIIPDEATRFKSKTSQTWKAMKFLSKKTKYLWPLTGTPLEIRLDELYNIFATVRPAVLGNYPRFREQHCITDWSNTIVGVQNLELLRDRVGYWMLRRTKKEVLDKLPEKLPPENRFIQMTTIEQKEYQELIMEFSDWLNKNDVESSSDPLVQTLRMQQYCCSPAIFGIDRKGSKYQELLNVIEEWGGRLLVFCFFKEMINLLTDWLSKDIKDFNPRAVITGDVKAEDRIKRVDEFNAGKLGKVFLSTDAGNQGLNITGADMVVHYAPLWNPQKMKQREDRAHRIGQKNVVNVINLLYMDTIDYGMFLVGEERRQLFQDIVEEAETAMLKKIGSARLKKIIEGRI